MVEQVEANYIKLEKTIHKFSVKISCVVTHGLNPLPKSTVYLGRKLHYTCRKNCNQFVFNLVGDMFIKLHLYL